MTKENFRIVRVVTRDFVTDFFQGIKNMFGFRLRGYERVIDRGIKEMLEEMELKYKVDWYRLVINDLTRGSAMMVIYGTGEKRELK